MATATSIRDPALVANPVPAAAPALSIPGTSIYVSIAEAFSLLPKP